MTNCMNKAKAVHPKTFWEGGLGEGDEKKQHKKWI